WIGGDEFHQHALASADVAAAVAVARVQNPVDGGTKGRAAEEKIDEAGPGNLDPLDARIGRHGIDQLLRDFPRRAPCLLAEGHGNVAGEIAVRAVAGALDM